MSFLRLFDLPVLCVRHRELLWSFIWRDLKSRYQGSLLGRLWPLLNPIILFLVYYFVFAVIMRMRLAERGEIIGGEALTALYIISGIIPWVAFADSLGRCTGVVLENGNLVKKIAFPSQLLPVYAVAVNFIYFFIALAIFLVLRVTMFGEVEGRGGEILVGLPPHWPIVFLAIALEFVFCVGLGLLLGALNIFVRDTAQVIPLLLNLWFFTTPIVYTTDLIQGQLPEWVWLMELNPMYHLMEVYRAGLVYEHVDADPWRSLLIFAVWSVAVYVPGYAFFRATKGRFADEL